MSTEEAAIASPQPRPVGPSGRRGGVAGTLRRLRRIWNVRGDFVPDELRQNGPFRLHHPIFRTFPPVKRRAPNGGLADYIGALIDGHYLPLPPDNLPPPSVMGRNNSYPGPPIDEEYFEWIDLLMSVHDAEGGYTAVELGAGFGRWGVRAGMAARLKGLDPVRLIFAEAEPHHAAWLHDHLKLNGFGTDDYELYEAAVSDREGEIEFTIGGPESFGDDNPQKWYGQTISKDYERPDEAGSDGGDYFGRQVIVYASGWKGIRVPVHDIDALLPGWGTVDIMDIDVQGEELKIIARGARRMSRQVKRLHIGTHNHEVEDGMRDILNRNGWINLRDYPCQTTSETPYGPVYFGDGVQSWINPRFRVTLG